MADNKIQPKIIKGGQQLSQEEIQRKMAIQKFYNEKKDLTFAIVSSMARQVDPGVLTEEACTDIARKASMLAEKTMLTLYDVKAE